MAATIWHHWCQPYGNPETIRSDRGKVWTSKLESRINNLGPLEPKITCRSERENFNPEIRQQWQQSRLDTPAEEFAQAWNLLCNLRTPGKVLTGLHDLDQIDQDLDDIEDFVEYDVDLEHHRFGKLKPQIPIQRRQVSLCRHKLQARAFPKSPNRRKVWRSSEPKSTPENQDLDHEWLQLIQLEKEIDEQKKLLLATKTGHHEDLEEDNDLFWEDGESLAKQGDHLDDGDLEYVNNILNSFSRPTSNHEDSNNLKFINTTQKVAMPRALASRATPQKFNLKFNQKLTNCRSEKNQFSYFSTVEEERPIELGDYFSDDEEEDDTCDQEDQKSEDFYQWNPIISSLETIHEPEVDNHDQANQFNPISGFSEEARLSLSTWQAFIPLDHAFQSYAAQSSPLDFLSQASSLQEPTLARISTISTSTKQTASPMEPISP